ncbi:MAG: vWA domain-containing protein, partial [Verrucomicrobiales bacterium]
MIFADPVWLWGILLLVPVLVFKMVNLATKNNKTSNFVAQNLKKLLVHGSNRKIKLIKYIVLSFAFSFILIAMARPQWGHEDQQSFSKGRTVMIAIDASRSMLAEDLTPNRLSRAKLAAYDLIDALPEDLIGLMAFSGSASVMVPVTPDRSALKESIEQLDTYSVAKGGTNLGEAIKRANEVLIESDTDSHALVLFTDGENLDGDTIVEAKNARDKGTIIVTIGVGSEVGSIIPDDRSRKNQTNFIRDESGKLVKSKLDIKTLTNIAETANGVFLRLDTNSINSEIINTTLDKLDTKETEFRDQKIPIERFGWPLGIGLFLIISVMSFDILNSIFMSKIKALTIFIGFFSICLIEENSAGVISDAKDSFESGNYTEAVDLYQKAISESKS